MNLIDKSEEEKGGSSKELENELNRMFSGAASSKRGLVKGP
jgi:hypothetical protein